MYCPNCGEKEGGNYCSKCGEALSGGRSHDLNETDWRFETNYSTLLRIAEVRDLISLSAKKNSKNMLIDEWFDLFGGPLKPLTGGVPIGKLAAISLPIANRLGISIEKKRSAEISFPVGKSIVSLLCLFAELALKVVRVEQAEDGCIIEATVPSDLWSWEGVILIVVQRREKGTSVDATISIKGQMFDFGKSERLLDKLFSHIARQ